MNAYAGKSLHVAIEAGEMEPYAIFTNDGDAPIARCVDRGTAHLFAAAPELAAFVKDAVAAMYGERPELDIMELRQRGAELIRKAGVL